LALLSGFVYYASFKRQAGDEDCFIFTFARPSAGLGA